MQMRAVLIESHLLNDSNASEKRFHRFVLRFRLTRAFAGLGSCTPRSVWPKKRTWLVANEGQHRTDEGGPKRMT